MQYVILYFNTLWRTHNCGLLKTVTDTPRKLSRRRLHIFSSICIIVWYMMAMLMWFVQLPTAYYLCLLFLRTCFDVALNNNGGFIIWSLMISNWINTPNWWRTHATIKIIQFAILWAMNQWCNEIRVHNPGMRLQIMFFITLKSCNMTLHVVCFIIYLTSNDNQ